MTGFERAARSEEVSSVCFLRVQVRGQPLLLARTSGGTPIAFGTICPHQHLPLDEGTIWGDAIDCPHHHYTYDPRTGANVYPARVFPAERAERVEGIPVFETYEAEGWVWVGPQRAP